MHRHSQMCYHDKNVLCGKPTHTHQDDRTAVGDYKADAALSLVRILRAVSVSARWHRGVSESPHDLCSVSQESPQGCPRGRIAVGLALTLIALAPRVGNTVCVLPLPPPPPPTPTHTPPHSFRHSVLSQGWLGCLHWESISSHSAPFCLAKLWRLLCLPDRHPV